MGYMHIDNLDKDQRILQFAECWALEKIHGTSAHVKFTMAPGGESVLVFYSGGEKYTNFVALFNQDYLRGALTALGQPEVIIYGEAYGGKQQGMKDTYGPKLKFIVFDVKMGGNWLDVPFAETLARYLKLEFVDYKRVPATLEALNIERDRESTQAIRNGMGQGKMREGIVIRPISEVIDEGGGRLMVKYKRTEFRETATVRPVDPKQAKVLLVAAVIATEWVTPMRFQHVLDRAKALKNAAGDSTPITHEDTGVIIKMMIEDVLREAKGKIEESRPIRSAIGKAAARLFEDYINKQIQEAVNEQF